MRRIYLLLLAWALIQCDGSDTLSNDEVIYVDGLEQDSYPVDSYNKIDLVISLTPGVANKFRKVKLECTGGTFSPATLILPEGNDAGTVQFIPGLVPGLFDIKVSIENKPEVFVIKTIQLKAQDASDVFSLTLPTALSYANGKSQLTGQIEVLNSDVKSFTLKSTDATSLFLPEGKSEITVSVNMDRMIPFTLRVGTTPGNFFLQVTAKDSRNLSQERAFTLSPLSVNQVLDLHFEGSKLKANGIDTLKGYVRILDYPISKLKLVTSAGSWAGANGSRELFLSTDGNGVVHFSIVSGTSTAPYYITTQLDGTTFIQDLILQAETVYPDYIYLEPTSYEISGNQTVSISAFLLCNKGKPSDNLKVEFTATQNQEGTIVNVGSLKNYPFSSGTIQKATAVFAMDTRKPIANIPITVTASVSNKGSVISSSVILVPSN